MVAEFRTRRDVVVAGLNRIPGITCKTPKGAFYVFPNIRDLGLPSQVIADRLLEEAGVAVLSGTAFGAQGEGFIRLSYATSVKEIERGLERIEGFVRKVRRG